MRCDNFTQTRERISGALSISSILLICIYFCLLSCDKNKNATDPSATSQYEVPVQTNDGWETASLSSVGMDETPLLKLLDKLNEIGDHRIHSLLIVKDGKLVFEEYFPGNKFNLARFTGETGFDMYDTHNLCSATKSFTSALIGIAIDKGFIQSVDQKVFDFFPEHSELLTIAPEKHDITLEHLLTMRSGLEWDDETYSYFDPRNDMYQLFNSSDPIRYILSKDLIETPGTVFAYRNCNTNLLGEIVRRASGQRLDIFARDYLFGKLGVTDYEWQRLPNNVIFCSGDLRLRPRDMAKFGQLFLNGGTWEKEQAISQEWVEISTQKFTSLNNWWGGVDGYGYQWWQWEEIYGVNYPAYMASGWGGQWIIVSPDMNTVVITTAGNYYTDVLMPVQTILVNYILPSISHDMVSINKLE
jgi:CubicO group peptidase (beta-lactamase class C family)